LRVPIVNNYAHSSLKECTQALRLPLVPLSTS
jgi:hypothetical protein